MHKQFSAIIADKDTWRAPHKRSGSQNLILVAVQKSRRTARKGKTKYVYSLEGTDMVYWNRSRDGVIFYPLGYNEKSMKLYHDVFCENPCTAKESQWLERYNYEVLTRG